MADSIWCSAEQPADITGTCIINCRNETGLDMFHTGGESRFWD